MNAGVAGSSTQGACRVRFAVVLERKPGGGFELSFCLRVGVTARSSSPCHRLEQFGACSLRCEFHVVGAGLGLRCVAKRAFVGARKAAVGWQAVPGFTEPVGSADCPALLGLAGPWRNSLREQARCVRTDATSQKTNALRAARKPCAARRLRGAPPRPPPARSLAGHDCFWGEGNT